MDTEDKVIICTIGWSASIWSSILTFCIMALCFWFNFQWIGGNDLVDTILFIAFWIIVFSRCDKGEHIIKAKTIDDAIARLHILKDKEIRNDN